LDYAKFKSNLIQKAYFSYNPFHTLVFIFCWAMANNNQIWLCTSILLILN